MWGSGNGYKSGMNLNVNDEVKRALTVAMETRLRSHSPYSQFKVGAAFKFKGIADAVGGCNVENASYGATMCAERTALFSAVAELGHDLEPEFLVIVTEEQRATAPCGLCLQVLAEFCMDEMPIYLANLNGVIAVHAFKDFLPFAFRRFSKDSLS